MVACSTRVRSFADRLAARRALCGWRRTARGLRNQSMAVKALMDDWRGRVVGAAFCFWRAFAAWSAHVLRVESTFRKRSAALRLRASFRVLQRGVWYLRLVRRCEVRQLREAWAAWRKWSTRRRRNLRVAAAAAAGRQLHVCQQALAVWALAAAGRRVRLQSEEVGRMMSYVAHLQLELDCARGEQYAALASTRAHQAHIAAMELEAARCLRTVAVCGGAGGWLAHCTTNLPNCHGTTMKVWNDA